MNEVNEVTARNRITGEVRTFKLTCDHPASSYGMPVLVDLETREAVDRLWWEIAECERELYTFTQFLADTQIEPKAFELPPKQLLPLWDVWREEYLRFCRENDCDHELLD